MLYRPKFCCNCGEKVEREDWRVWTSRRFCALCETEYKPYDLLPRAFVGVGAFLALFGLAGYFGGPTPTQVGPERAAANRTIPKVTLYSGTNVAKNAHPTAANNADEQTQQEANRLARQITEQPKTEKNTSDETVFYCGALTKKGTPCTRRVKKKGHCWQHAKTAAIGPARF